MKCPLIPWAKWYRMKVGDTFLYLCEGHDMSTMIIGNAMEWEVGSIHDLHLMHISSMEQQCHVTLFYETCISIPNVGFYQDIIGMRDEFCYLLQTLWEVKHLERHSSYKLAVVPRFQFSPLSYYYTLREKWYNDVALPHPVSFCILYFIFLNDFENTLNKSIHWIWISQQNTFDGDFPYSFNDLFARV